MKGLPEDRAVKLAQYIIENNATVRQTAEKYNISKSTVHKDVSERLRAYNESLYRQVKRVLEQNKSERHIRGGQATKCKYQRLRGK
ncbi:MAG: sporulation transcriptional regulator SpoIIID [Oscillospiraceae bacterium]|nr:sporulation transcriptional regulator SpoIIID [Oscillospiraceae bacterium]